MLIRINSLLNRSSYWNSQEEKVSRLVLLWNTMALLAQMSGVVEQGLLREMQGQTPVTIKSSLLQMREQI
jgi:hypothetical protein